MNGWSSETLKKITDIQVAYALSKLLGIDNETAKKIVKTASLLVYIANDELLYNSLFDMIEHANTINSVVDKVDISYRVTSYRVTE